MKQNERTEPKIDYRYLIHGRVPTPRGMRDAIFYTDTFVKVDDRLEYTNSDGSLQKIYPPFTIGHIKNNETNRRTNN